MKNVSKAAELSVAESVGGLIVDAVNIPNDYYYFSAINLHLPLNTINENNSRNL